MILIGCLVAEPHISLWAAAVTAVKFGLPMGVGRVVLNRSHRDRDWSKLLRNNASWPGCAAKLPIRTTNPKVILFYVQRFRSSQQLLRTVLRKFDIK